MRGRVKERIRREAGGCQEGEVGRRVVDGYEVCVCVCVCVCVREREREKG